MITMRETEEKDIDFIVSCLKDKPEDFIGQCGYGKRFFTFPITTEQLLTFQATRKEASSFFTILNDGIMIGSFELMIDKSQEKCTVARFLISDKYRFRGYGADTLKVLTEYAFNELHLKKITLGVFDFNRSALKCYQKAGFTETSRVKIDDWLRIDMEIINPAF